MKKNEIDKWEYRYIHDWIRANYGKANHCENPDCKGGKIKRYEWALKKGFKYEYKIDNYIQLCVRCHREYDTPGFTGKKHTEESKQKMRDKKIGKSPWNKGLKGCYSAEIIEKMKNGRKDYKTSEETKVKISIAGKGKKRSEETKKKISDAIKNWHANKE